MELVFKHFNGEIQCVKYCPCTRNCEIRVYEISHSSSLLFPMKRHNSHQLLCKREDLVTSKLVLMFQLFTSPNHAHPTCMQFEQKLEKSTSDIRQINCYWKAVTRKERKAMHGSRPRAWITFHIKYASKRFQHPTIREHALNKIVVLNGFI